MLNEARLIDADGDVVTTPGARGELCVRGDTVTPGYWNMAEETAAALGPDGWLRTGDVAYQDEDGYYNMAGRLEDMIISGGENFYPAEVESVLYGHPAIAEVAVIGAPNDRWGERVVAVVVPVPGARLELEELREFAGAAGPVQVAARTAHRRPTPAEHDREGPRARIACDEWHRRLIAGAAAGHMR